jgi:hypothetical protein
MHQVNASYLTKLIGCSVAAVHCTLFIANSYSDPFFKNLTPQFVQIIVMKFNPIFYIQTAM